MRKDATVVGSWSDTDLVACLEHARLAGRNRELGIATLGPRGTSSEVAAYRVLGLCGEEIGDGGRVRLCPSFEEAGEAVVEGSETALVVANAYSEINALYMNPALFLAGAFILPTPDYGVVAPPNAPLPLKVSIATHPAPRALIDELVPPSFLVRETLPATSTSEAALMVARGEVDLALTNETSAREHRLRFVSRTRPIRMLWSVFVSAKRLGSRKAP